MKNTPIKHSGQNQNLPHKTISILNEGYEKLIKTFDELSGTMSKHNEILLNSDSKTPKFLENNLRSFSIIFKSFIELRESFNQYYTSIHDSLNEKSEFGSFLDENNINSINSHSTSNKSHSLSLTPKIKSSYDKVFNEFLKIEKSTKELNSIKKDLDEKRKNRIKMLELKLQGFCDEIKNVNFNNIQKQLEDLALTGSITINTINNYGKVNKSSNMLIANDVLKYECNYDKNFPPEMMDELLNQNKNTIDYAGDKLTVDIGVDKMEENTMVNQNLPTEIEKNTENNVLLNQILNLNSTNGGEMMQFIESLLMKTESEVDLNNTVKNLKK